MNYEVVIKENGVAYLYLNGAFVSAVTVTDRLTGHRRADRRLAAKVQKLEKLEAKLIKLKA
jgi:hypothetical protein